MMDGRHMIMILAPKAAKASFAEKKAARENTKGNQGTGIKRLSQLACAPFYEHWKERLHHA